MSVENRNVRRVRDEDTSEALMSGRCRATYSTRHAELYGLPIAICKLCGGARQLSYKQVCPTKDFLNKNKK